MPIPSDCGPGSNLGIAGKVAVVTAAGRGIGRASALLFARWGATVITVDLDPQALAALVSEAVSVDGVVKAATADVCDEEAVTRLI